MSSEARLKRLGLQHLADQPEALARELRRRMAEYDAQRAVRKAASRPAPKGR